MILQFTKDYIIANKGCYTLKQVNSLGFINNRIITIEDIFNSEIPIKDKICFLWLNSIFYEDRKKIWNNSKEIRRIVDPNNSGLGWVFHYSYFCYAFTVEVAYYSLKDQKIIIKELLKYVKKLRKSK